MLNKAKKKKKKGFNKFASSYASLEAPDLITELAKKKAKKTLLKGRTIWLRWVCSKQCLLPYVFAVRFVDEFTATMLLYHFAKFIIVSRCLAHSTALGVITLGWA